MGKDEGLRPGSDQRRQWVNWISDAVSKLLIVIVDSDFESGLEILDGTPEERKQYLSFLLSRLFFPFASVGLVVLFISLNVVSNRFCSAVTVPVWYFINLVLTAYPFCVLWPWTPRKERLWMDHLDASITKELNVDGGVTGVGSGTASGGNRSGGTGAGAAGARHRRSSTSFFEHAGESIFKVSRIVLVYAAGVSILTSLTEYAASFKVCC